MVRHPFQKLCSVPSSNALVAAAGSKVYAIDLPSGRIAWRLHEVLLQTTADGQQANGQEPSAKRRKLDDQNAATEQGAASSRRSSEDSVNFKTERLKGERKKPKVEIESPPPNVSHILATRDGAHLIVVTAEDKAISVYEIGTFGPALKSRRTMPKRLCSATLTPDERWLVVGDKFGDVYEMPLLPSEDWVAPEKKLRTTFEPSATELTVHTQGNLQALKQQKEQKMKAAEKEGLNFEHRVLLGHVSLLTDVRMAESMVAGKQRTFVLTADRDEHVRVSRHPQSHIIERYCLGIREFVSRLCVLPWASQLVAVGTGEPSLRVYEWLSGRLLSIDGFEGLTEKLSHILSAPGEDRDPQKLAVFGIWPVLQIHEATGHTEAGRLLVTLEGVPLLLSYTVNNDGRLHLEQTIELTGNVLDVAVVADQQAIIVSLDTAHLPGSTLSIHAASDASTPKLQAFRLHHTNGIASWIPFDEQSSGLSSAVAQVSDLPELPASVVEGSRGRSDRKSPYSSVGNFLYGLENLRKKRDFTGRDAEDEDGEGEVVLPEGEAPIEEQ